MIDPDLYEDFVKRDKPKKKNYNDLRFKTGFNNSNLISLDGIGSGVRAGNSALGQLTKKIEGFSFKEEKNKKSKYFFTFIRKFN